LPKHLERKIDSDYPSATAFNQFAKIPRATREINNDVPVSHANLIQRTTPPSLIHPNGHHAIQRVVFRRDAIEHILHANALFFSGRQIT
jgi:hypothetical protein